MDFDTFDTENDSGDMDSDTQGVSAVKVETKAPEKNDSTNDTGTGDINPPAKNSTRRTRRTNKEINEHLFNKWRKDGVCSTVTKPWMTPDNISAEDWKTFLDASCPNWQNESKCADLLRQVARGGDAKPPSSTPAVQRVHSSSSNINKNTNRTNQQLHFNKETKAVIGALAYIAESHQPKMQKNKLQIATMYTVIGLNNTDSGDPDEEMTDLQRDIWNATTGLFTNDKTASVMLDSYIAKIENIWKIDIEDSLRKYQGGEYTDQEIQRLQKLAKMIDYNKQYFVSTIVPIGESSLRLNDKFKVDLSEADNLTGASGDEIDDKKLQLQAEFDTATEDLEKALQPYGVSLEGLTALLQSGKKPPLTASSRSPRRTKSTKKVKHNDPNNAGMAGQLFEFLTQRDLRNQNPDKITTETVGLSSFTSRFRSVDPIIRKELMDKLNKLPLRSFAQDTSMSFMEDSENIIEIFQGEMKTIGLGSCSALLSKDVFSSTNVLGVVGRLKCFPNLLPTVVVGYLQELQSLVVDKAMDILNELEQEGTDFDMD